MKGTDQGQAKRALCEKAYGLFREFRGAYVSEWQRLENCERMYRGDHWHDVQMLDRNEPNLNKLNTHKNRRNQTMQYMTEAQIDGIATATGKSLAKEDKVTITIQPESGESHWEGGINGHFFRIRTGEPVDVPQSLATLIAQSMQVRYESEARVRAYRKSGGKKVS